MNALLILASISLISFWKKIPSVCHYNARVLIAYIEGLLYYKVPGEAEKLLVSTLKHQYNKELFAYYALFKSSREDKQIALLETIHAKHPKDAELLYYLGCWYANHSVWGKAEEYLRKSLEITPHQPKVLFELGKIALELNNPQKALSLWSGLDKDLLIRPFE